MPITQPTDDAHALGTFHRCQKSSSSRSSRTIVSKILNIPTTHFNYRAARYKEKG